MGLQARGDKQLNSGAARGAADAGKILSTHFLTAHRFETLASSANTCYPPRMFKVLSVFTAVFVVALALLFIGAPTKQQVFRSQTWWFKGVCDSTDQVYKWKIIGLPEQSSWHIKPWLPVPIYIRGIELTLISGDISGWWGAGNNIVGDMMVFIGPGETHARHDFPPPSSMPMPAAGKAKPLDYLDLHGLCNGGNLAAIWYTVYYTE
jgi:hypothetical protein